MHQMLECYVILNQTLVVRILDLHLFCDTGADKREPVGYPELLAGIDRRAHERALYGEKLGEQLR